ncbi:MAG: hypothetical protein DMD48_00515 [Gemmatimonadetes bacterium]|nr:MAG: hypothetical protein DMD48_00515 [Gemmatimonadota bacterium]
MTLLSLLAFSLASAHSQSPAAPGPPPPPLAVTRLGSKDAYGAGIVAVQDDAILVELSRAAHVILVRVDGDGSIQPVFPTPGDTSNALPAGRHIVGIVGLQPNWSGPVPAAPSYEPVVRSADALARQGRTARPSATGDDDPLARRAAVAHWLLVVADVSTSAEDVETLLSSMSRDFSSMKAELEAVAQALTKRRTHLWSAFYAPVRTP